MLRLNSRFPADSWGFWQTTVGMDKGPVNRQLDSEGKVRNLAPLLG
jgi:hypothetical protein